MTEHPKDVVRQLMQAYNDKSLERLLELFHPDAFFWDPFHRDGVRGREAIGSVVGRLFESLPDERMHLQTLAADDRYVVAEFRSSGTAAGRAFEVEFTEVYEVDGGRIASCRVYIDPEEVPGIEPDDG